MADTKNNSLPEEERMIPEDAAVKIFLAERNMRAVMLATAPKYGGRPPDKEMVLSALAQSRVTMGIDMEAADRFVANPVYERDVEIARGRVPENGRDAELVYHFDKAAEVKPTERADGTVDYYDLGLIQHVSRGQLLVEKIPYMEGEPGFNVMGEPLQPKRGRDLNLPVGTNTEVSDDGLKLYAAKSGHVELVRGKVTVADKFDLKEDVSIATGNINFDGDVIVNGSVRSGFAVTATGSIVIKGTCEAATLRAGGSITVSEGVNGGDVEAGGEVKSKYIQSATVYAGGNVYTEFILNSDLKSGGSVIVSGQRATIAGGYCSAAKSIETKFIGSNNTMVVTRVEVGLDPVVQERLTEAPKELQANEKNLQSLAQLIQLLEQLKERGRLDDEKAKKLEIAINSREHGLAMKTELENEIADLEKKSETLGFGTIIAKGHIAPGTKIVIGPYHTDVTNPIPNAKVTRGHDGLNIGVAV